jgi:hypothetical protein
VNELAFTPPLAGIAGWALHVAWIRHSKVRADAYLRRLLAPRIATFRTDYARLGSGR